MRRKTQRWECCCVISSLSRHSRVRRASWWPSVDGTASFWGEWGSEQSQAQLPYVTLSFLSCSQHLWETHGLGFERDSFPTHENLSDLSVHWKTEFLFFNNKRLGMPITSFRHVCTGVPVDRNM